MNRRLYICIVLLFLGFQFSNAQDPNVVGGKSSVKMDFKKISVKTKKTLNEANRANVSAKARSARPIDELCIRDPRTGDCIEDEDCKKDFRTGKCIDDDDCLRDPRTGDCVDVDTGGGSTTEAGSTAGSLSVSLTGAASYSIPVMVPPGIKDVAPNIGISYTSQGANGLAGWGWNVSGLSTISRIPATKYYDNKHDGIDFKDDRFSIDGQRLIIKSGTYGASGSVYQTENYSNVKVVAYGSSPYGSTFGPSYFIVYYPNGTRAWYGNAGNSRSRLEWAIFRWQDPQGNYVDYNYQSDNGLLSIKTIKYGGRIGSTSPMNQLNFTYTTRSRPENVYVGEYNFKRTNLLRSIQVTASGSQYRKYELTHNTTSLGYQRLTSVKEYNAQNKALRPITFVYDTTSSWVSDRNEIRAYPRFDYRTSSLIAGDYDGDGRTDIIYYDKNTRDKIFIHTKLYNRNSIAYQIDAEKFSDVFSSTILSSNNKILNQQAVTTVRETSSSSSSSTSAVRFRTFAQAAYGPVHQYDRVWSTPKYKTDNYCGNTSYRAIPKKYISGDFNGDGLTDVIAIEKQYYARYCRPNRDCDGDDWIRYKAKKEEEETKSDSTKNETLKKALPPDEDCCECESYTSNQYNAKVHFIDLKRTVTSNFSNAAGYFRKGIGSKDIIQVGDHNGDGKQDIYHFQEGKLYIYTLNLNNNLVLLHEEIDSGIKLDNPILLGDYNGDGKTDFLTATVNKSKNWKYFISKGKDFYKQTKSIPFGYYQDEIIQNTHYEYRYTAQDVNGDGKTDVIMHNINHSSQRGVYPKEYISIYKNIQSLSNPTPSFAYETGYTKTTGCQRGECSSVSKFGFPIFLESNITNGNLEYGYISGNGIFMYEFAKDHRKDATLKSVTNNGVKTTINYERLGISESPYGSQIYTPDYSQTYPYINVNRANSFQLVKKLTEEGAGIKRYQDFMYHGAVSNINIGFQGFLKTKRSNWYGNGVGTLWTISKHDVTKKGAVTEQWVSTSSHESNSYMSKTTNTYSTHLASNKVYTNIPTRVVQQNALNGITTTKNYTYDAYKNLQTQSTVFNGGSKNLAYTYSNNPTTNSIYYHIGRVIKKIKTKTIGSNAFTTEEQYSYTNNLVTQQKVKGVGTTWNTESYLYDSFGNVTKKTLTISGLAARSESFKYTGGRFLNESTGTEGLKTKFTYDKFGNPLTTTNPFNQTTVFTYDGWNRLKTERNYLNKITMFSYEYLSGGGLRKTTNYPQGADNIIEYNALGWVLKSKVLGLNNKWTQKSFRYDVAGRKIRESEPYFTSLNQWNSVAYDNYGREIVRTSFNGLVANVTYNGLITTVNDGTKTVKTTKDGGGNIVKMEDPGGVINYTYFGNGVMKTANYGGNLVETEIDGWGRKIKLTDPSAGTYTYEYDNLGQVQKETTPKGYTEYDYNDFGKIIKKIVKGENTDLILNYKYDEADDKLLDKILGTNNSTNESYTYTYLYDSKKRPYFTKEQNGKAVFEHSLVYDSYGRVSTEDYKTVNSGNNVSSTVKVLNQYDTYSGVLEKIVDRATLKNLWTINEVNQRGQALKVTLGNGVSKNKTYDQYGFLTKIYDRASSVALDIDYSFNTTRGNLNSRKNNNLGWNESFTYDHLDRLTNITGAVSRNQQYDTRGRITSNSEIGTYNYESNNVYQLKDVNLNTKGDLHYQNQPLQKIKYNAYKKPISIAVKDKAKVDFEYGILQNRSHAYYGGNEDNKLDRRYQKHYSGITPVEIEEDNQGNTKIITYIGGDAYSAPIVHIKQTTAGSANGFHYLHKDYLGSILAITDSSANVKEQRQFGAWGGIDKFKKGNSEIVFKNSTTLLNRGYTGHEHFVEVGLIHMNGRMYDAELGRFLSPDNYIQEPFNTQSFNRYGYVWNNPLKFTDPSGESFLLAA
jgi:RHS repeat-associated protein